MPTLAVFINVPTVVDFFCAEVGSCQACLLSVCCDCGFMVERVNSIVLGGQLWSYIYLMGSDPGLGSISRFTHVGRYGNFNLL